MKASIYKFCTSWLGNEFKKTKIMTNGVENPMEITVHQTFNNVRVNKYFYLGQEIKMGKENQLYEINRHITKFLKYQFQKLVYPVSINIWSRNLDANKRNKVHKSQVAQRALERKLAGITFKDHKTNVWLRQESRVADVTKPGSNLKCRWAGHVTQKHCSRYKTVL